MQKCDAGFIICWLGVIKTAIGPVGHTQYTFTRKSVDELFLYFYSHFGINWNSCAFCSGKKMFYWEQEHAKSFTWNQQIKYWWFKLSGSFVYPVYEPGGQPIIGPLFAQTSSLSDHHPATSSQEICRTSCSHAGDAESWLGRSRLLPNCAFESCWEMRVTTGLHAVWGHSSGRSTDGIQPSRVSLMCWSKGQQSYASVGWMMATRVEAGDPQPEHFCIFSGLCVFVCVCACACVNTSLQISSHTLASASPSLCILRLDDPSLPLSLYSSLSISFIPASPLQHSTSQPLLFSPHTHPSLHLSSLRWLLAR